MHRTNIMANSRWALTVAGALLAGSVWCPPQCPAQPPTPEAQAAVARGIAWLKANWSSAGVGRASFAAYALLKAGEPVTTPEVQQAIAGVYAKIQNGAYVNNDHYATYIAAVDLMLLEAADPDTHREALEAITRFLVETQRPDGYWEYPREDRGGDTSQTQYALLGLWAARRAGLQVPDQVWDKAARWLTVTQFSDGGSAYTPRDSTPNVEGWRVTASYTMTTATIGSLAVVLRMLHPDADDPLAEQRPQPEPTRKFGFLERVDLTAPEGDPAGANAGPYKPQTSAADLNAAIRRGMGWYTPRYRISGVTNQLYYLYGLERMAALTDVETIGGNNWYAQGIDYLLKNQKTDGSWSGEASQDHAGTTFGILFIVRATSKILGRVRPIEALGAGLLKGGRGLPSDLSQALLEDGKVAARKVTDPIEKLLAELEKQDAPQVEAVQQALVESVQLGNRDELIGQKDRLVSLARHPQAEVRRTALWALGRSDDLKLLRLMVQALQDPDVGVRIEAHNALCALSRRPNGFEGLLNDPLEGVAEDASEQDKQAAVDRWSKAIYDKWHAWYLTVRPYDERDDLQEPKPARR